MRKQDRNFAALMGQCPREARGLTVNISAMAATVANPRFSSGILQPLLIPLVEVPGE
jgi:hypothetical protein